MEGSRSCGCLTGFEHLANVTVDGSTPFSSDQRGLSIVVMQQFAKLLGVTASPVRSWHPLPFQRRTMTKRQQANILKEALEYAGEARVETWYQPRDFTMANGYINELAGWYFDSDDEICAFLDHDFEDALKATEKHKRLYVLEYEGSQKKPAVYA